MLNRITLIHNYSRFTKSELKKFKRGDSLWGDCESPEELMHWDIADKAKAKAELAKYKNSYRYGYQLTDIDEYGLEYAEYDEDGEFVEGCDYDIAEDDPENPYKGNKWWV